MKILITGASGFIGSSLIPYLIKQGHTIATLVRSHDRLSDSSALWDPVAGSIDIPKLDWIGGDDGFGAVINLAGRNLSSGRWNDQIKADILSSRVRSTMLISETITKLKKHPEVFVSASAVGFYGGRGNEILNEDSESGNNFLADVVRQWEHATISAADAGIRVVNSRFGLVLSTKGGILQQMIKAARIGAATPFGEGDQYMSWISIEDFNRAIMHVIKNATLSGPVNLTSQTPVTNKDFMLTLGYHFKAPVNMHVPEFVLRIIFGDMADNLLLASQRVMPVKLLMSGFRFRHIKLEPTLNYLLENKI